MQQIREESIDWLMQYKRAQLIKRREEEKKRAIWKVIPIDTKVEVKPEEITLTDKEIEDWMSLRVVWALQRKIEAATMELLGDTNLIGFLYEETLEESIRWLVFQSLQNQTPVPQELETV